MQEKEMSVTALKECYSKFSQYVDTYKPDDPDYLRVLADMRNHLESISDGVDVDLFVKNPRGAGPKSYRSPKLTEKICNLRKAGKGIRAISRETCEATSYIYAVLHENGLE